MKQLLDSDWPRAIREFSKRMMSHKMMIDENFVQKL